MWGWFDRFKYIKIKCGIFSCIFRLIYCSFLGVKKWINLQLSVWRKYCIYCNPPIFCHIQLSETSCSSQPSSFFELSFLLSPFSQLPQPFQRVKTPDASFVHPISRNLWKAPRKQHEWKEKAAKSMEWNEWGQHCSNRYSVYTRAENHQFSSFIPVPCKYTLCEWILIQPRF